VKAIGRTQSLVIAALLVVVVMAGGWLGLVKPAKSSVSNLKTQATTQESGNASLRLQLAVLKDLARRLPQQQAELARITTKVPNQAQLANLLRQLVVSAKDAGVSLTGLTPTQPADLVGAPGIKYVDLVITFSGGYAEVEQFDSALEGLSRTLMVKDFTLGGATSTTGTTGTSSSTSASTSTISATFNGRVLVRDATATTAPAAAASTTATH
jgi:Tfp pilus assembly protein PilO